MNRTDKIRKRTLIIGAGEAGKLLIQYLQMNVSCNFEVIGILDDHVNEKAVLGIPFVGTLQSIGPVVQEKQIEHIILAIPSLKPREKIAVLNRCSETGIQTEIMPDIEAIIRGEGSMAAIQNIDYADLLDRDEAQQDYHKLTPRFAGKTVLITGAGGSIGSEVVRQVAKCMPKTIILLGHGENSIYNIHREMAEKIDSTLIPIIADVQDKERLSEVFSKYQPEIIYHAAAHKHVPMMELNVREAVKNNIIGTKNLVDVSHENGVELFIMISTDKSVEPTSVMGATKKLAEWIVQMKNEEEGSGIYSIVRFGNVLGSRGSAIPLFWEQIKSGKTVTITHPDMERYFMTISEASQLVIEAGTVAKGGEVFILKMGTPQKIIEIVNKLIILAGKKKEQIEMKFIGLRDGEKIKEELFEMEEIAESEDGFAKFYCGKSRAPRKMKNIEKWIHLFESMNEDELRQALLKFANERVVLEKEYV
ncbi:nucleoside-diphosphate sugar epimerase/dehydratase [Listeria sp. SHR_NRA_18]|uniref:polysaccharide biosynthesis protein n=1 Tax=Listeria sp. SHR_NRA_18 TaxID=2269046 RepID=UPI00068BA469|nr:nucleoside-diphosphate sugar epimerase/dehydratase [Listeria sp. SHR_NRA_18]